MQSLRAVQMSIGAKNVHNTKIKTLVCDVVDSLAMEIELIVEIHINLILAMLQC